MTKSRTTRSTKRKTVRATTPTKTKAKPASKAKTTTSREPIKLNKRFRATLEKSPNRGGWTYVVMPGSAAFFGTGGLVKVRGTIDGQAFRASFMAMGDGRQMLPVKASVRELIGKDTGDAVTVVLTERLF